MNTENPYYQLEKNASQHPNRPSIISDEISLSWAEIKHQVDCIASKLRFLGIKQQDVLILKGRSVWSWKLQLAAMKLGAITASAVSSKSQPKFNNSYLLVQSKSDQKNPNVLLIDDAWLANAYSSFKAVPVEYHYQPEDTIRLIMTSGTTGTPKAAALSWEVFKSRFDFSLAQWDFPQPELSLIGFGSAVGFWAGVRSLASGESLIVADGTKGNVIDFVAKVGVKTLIGSPAQLAGESESWQDSDPRLASLELLISTGSSINSQLVRFLHTKAPNVRIYSRFGSAEAGGIAMRDMLDSRLHEKAIGPIQRHAEVKIVDENGSEVEDGTLGSLLVKSPYMSSGYFENEAETKLRFSAGWFRTGDLALRDENGNVILSARDSELINMGGHKVDPDEIDIVLKNHPDVKDAGTFEYLRPTGENLAISIIVPRQGAKVGEIVKYMKAQLGSHTSKIVIPALELPRNENGKLDRIKLKEMHQKTIENLLRQRRI